MTLGENRVRIKFNPSDNSLVSQIKQAAAELIDICEIQLMGTKDGEAVRLWRLAQTSIEDGAMWAVKAATYDT